MDDLFNGAVWTLGMTALLVAILACVLAAVYVGKLIVGVL